MILSSLDWVQQQMFELCCPRDMCRKAQRMRDRQAGDEQVHSRKGKRCELRAGLSHLGCIGPDKATTSSAYDLVGGKFVAHEPQIYASRVSMLVLEAVDALVTIELSFEASTLVARARRLLARDSAITAHVIQIFFMDNFSFFRLDSP